MTQPEIDTALDTFKTEKQLTQLDTAENLDKALDRAIDTVEQSPTA